MLRAMYNDVAGNVEGEYVDDTWFQQQYHNFYTNGTAMDPASSRIVIGDKEKAKNSKSIVFIPFSNVADLCLFYFMVINCR